MNLRKLIRNGPQFPPSKGSDSKESESKGSDSNVKAEETTEQMLDRLQSHTQSLLEGFADQTEVYQKIQQHFQLCKQVAKEKIELVDRMKALMDRQIKRLMNEIGKLDESDPMISGTSVSINATPFQQQQQLFTPASVAFQTPVAFNSYSTPSMPRSSFADPLLRVKRAEISSNLMDQSLTSTGQSSTSSIGFSATPQASLTTVPAITATPTPDAVSIPVRNASHQPQKRLHHKRKEPSASIGGVSRLQPPYSSSTGGDHVDEQLYCFCQQVSYGEMIACDNEDCPNEWFHLECVGLSEPPNGVWFCKDCVSSNKIIDKKKKIH